MVLLTVLFVVYFLFLIAALVGWNRSVEPSKVSRGGKEPLISVIVAARNEESTISGLLDSLAHQEYGNFEVLVVNDDSDDATLTTAASSNTKNVRVINSLGNGKKDAITAGIRASRGSIIATTDADCKVPTDWLKHIREAFRERGLEFLAGGVRMEGDGSFFATLQGMEFASLIGTAASTASLGFPTMCNGANLAFRKKAFSEVKGYVGNAAIPSGDDEFLMRKMQERYPGGVKFLYAPESVVTTKPQPDVQTFLNQRIRWASKWRHNTSLHTRTMAVLVVVFQLAFMGNWMYLFTPAVQQSLFLISLKIILEAAFLLQVCKFLDTRWKWAGFIVLQVTYPIYVIAVAAVSFFRPFEWKNRVFRPR